MMMKNRIKLEEVIILEVMTILEEMINKKKMMIIILLEVLYSIQVQQY
jgi:hypothetical protein